MDTTIIVALISAGGAIIAAVIASIPHLLKKPETSPTSPAAPSKRPLDEPAPPTKATKTKDASPKATVPVGGLSFSLIVHKTYYQQGFLNVGIDQEGRFGGDGQAIEIYCGGSHDPIVGTINRTANSNQTPRIMGGKALRDWFQTELNEMQEVTITVLSPTAIRITPRSV